MNKMIKDFEKWNESFVKKYDIDDYYKKSNFIVRFIEQKRIKEVIRLVNPKQADNIIELGCGAAHVLLEIPSGNLTGMDLSESMLDKARKKLQQADRKAVLVKGDVESLPEQIKKNKFDKIICSEVIEHVQRPDKVIDEILKISHPDSVIVISIPNEKFINKLKQVLIKLKIFPILFANISKKMDDEWHLHTFDLPLLKQIVGRKLKIKRITSIPFSFLPIRHVIKLEPWK